MYTSPLTTPRPIRQPHYAFDTIIKRQPYGVLLFPLPTSKSIHTAQLQFAYSTNTSTLECLAMNFELPQYRYDFTRHLFCVIVSFSCQLTCCMSLGKGYLHSPWLGVDAEQESGREGYTCYTRQHGQYIIYFHMLTSLAFLALITLVNLPHPPGPPPLQISY